MPRSTTISIRSAISSPARFTNKGAPPRWPSGAPSRPNRRLGLRVLRPTQTTCRCSDKALGRAWRSPTIESTAPRLSDLSRAILRLVEYAALAEVLRLNGGQFVEG